MAQSLAKAYLPGDCLCSEPMVLKRLKQGSTCIPGANNKMKD